MSIFSARLFFVWPDDFFSIFPDVCYVFVSRGRADGETLQKRENVVANKILNGASHGIITPFMKVIISR